MATMFEQIDRLELEAALQEQAELRQERQKMEALGRVTCAVAHDFNNLLSAIGLSIELVADHADPEILKGLREMMASSQRLTQQLVTFGKPAPSAESGRSDVGAVFDQLLPVLQTGCGRSIAIKRNAGSPELCVALEQSQLEQVLLNLCLNARDAISGTGQVTVTVRRSTTLDEVPPGFVVIEVHDTGAGMDEAVASRAFEPFFTTKTNGTGLGLATVHGIVRRAGGVLRVASERTKGTTMFVALPEASGV